MLSTDFARFFDMRYRIKAQLNLRCVFDISTDVHIVTTYCMTYAVAKSACVYRAKFFAKSLSGNSNGFKCCRLVCVEFSEDFGCVIYYIYPIISPVLKKIRPVWIFFIKYRFLFFGKILRVIFP